MRSKQVWRHYCDHCKRGMLSRPAMVKHEAHCTSNPNRTCRMCAHAQLVQRATCELVAILNDEGVDACLEAAAHCPACVFTAIRQVRKLERPTPENWIDFDFAKHRDAFFERYPGNEDGF